MKKIICKMITLWLRAWESKLLRSMRIVLLLILISAAQVFAVDTYAQSKRLSLSFKNEKIVNILDKIEDQSEFYFMYDATVIDVNQEKSIECENKPISNILNELFEKTGIDYSVSDRQIVLVSTVKENVAQQSKVSGKVSDEKGDPLPGVTVVVKNTVQGTVTNSNGEYTLLNIPENATLQFSFVGMVTQEIVVGNQSTVNVSLKTSDVGIDEVVVIGYGTRSKRDVTTAISSIDTEEITKSVSMTPEMAMQGRMTGVQVSDNSGNPMSRPTIRIRGVNTWGVSSPLYVIDGVPVTEMGGGIEGQEDLRAADVRGPLNIMTMIDPNDIESISVLKDASAAAIYGVRAANGVVLITTKKGRGDKPSVEFSSKFGIQNVTQHIDVLNTQQYTKHLQDVYASDPTLTVSPENVGVFDPASPKYLGNSPTYDWQTAVKNKNAPTQDYSLRISGGTGKTDYYASGNYASTKGALVGSDLERYSGSFKLNSQVNDWIKLGANYRISSASGHDNSFRLTFWEMAQTPPWQPIYDAKGPYGYAPTVGGLQTDGSYRSDKLWGEGTRINVPGLLKSADTEYNSLRNMGNAYIEIEPLKNLKIKGQVSIDKYVNTTYFFEDHRGSVFNYTAGDPRAITEGASVGKYTERDVYNNNLVKEVTINYNNSFNDHNIDLLFSGMDQQYDSKYNIMGTEYVTTILPYLRKLGGENKYTSVGSDLSRWALAGLLGRIGYNYKYTYYLDLTMRRDGSARFSPDNRWGNFPSVSAAWRITNESFMADLAWINDFKLRAGWGKLGNQEVRNMAYLSPIETRPTFAWGNVDNNGYGIFSSAATVFGLANPSLQWESTATTNIGFDAVLIKSLNFSMEYYNKITDGLLQEVALPNSVGVAQQPVDNIGSVRNLGIEISLNYSGEVGDFHYSVGGNLSTVKNNVEKTYKDIPLWNIEEGYPLFYQRGYKVGGIFQSQEEIDAWKAKYTDVNYQTAKIAPGDFYFQDLRGAPKNPDEFYSNEPDGKIDSYDQVYLGKTIPGYFYGLNFNLDYKGFDLNAQFTGVGDVVKYNNVRAALEYTPSTGGNLSVDALNYWSPTNKTSTMPRLIGGDPAANFRNSDYFVENASYLRLSNIQLGYTLPVSFSDFTNGNVKNVRVYVAASNLFTITGYTGIDPENDQFPAPRIFFTGLNIRF
jgi:TonB-linked SusC/RagA family outer membrane protein